MDTFIQEVIISGDPFQRGQMYGTAVKERVHEYLHDSFFRINRIRQHALSEHDANTHLDRYIDVLKVVRKDLLLELEGFAFGAEITLRQATALQYRRELIATFGDIANNRLEGDCTSFAFAHKSGYTLGQTIDQDGLIADMGLVLRIKPESASDPEILMYSFVGLLGYLGINSFGVGVCINFLTTSAVAPGISPYLLVREVLSCRSSGEAIERIERLPKSTARAFTIVNGNELNCCEFSTTSFCAWKQEDHFVRANHFLHPDLTTEDRLNIFSKNGSVKRQKIMADGLKESSLTIEGFFKLFSDHTLYPVGLCAHAEGDYKRPDTVAAVVLEPAVGTIWVCKGHPCVSPPVRFSISTSPTRKSNF